MFFRLLKFCLSLSFLLCFKIHSETLILQSSDQHSSYKKIQGFLTSIEVLYRDFKEKHPDGSVVLIINGDFSSFNKYSKFSWDKGNFGYSILSQLAEKYSIVYTFGNHDAFDWKDSQLFLDQMNLLKTSGVNLIVENIDLHSKYENLFSPYVDIPLSSKYKMRIIGYTLPRRKEKDLEKFQYNGPKIIQSINAINLEPALKSAERDYKVLTVAVSMHLGAKKVNRFFNHLAPDLTNKLNLMFAGHDHKQKIERLNNTFIIDSKAHFNFSKVLLDDYGEVRSVKFFDEKAQKKLNGSFDKESLESDLIDQTIKFLNIRKKRKKKLYAVPSPIPLINIPKKEREKTVRALNLKKNHKPHCIKVFYGKQSVNF